MKYKLTWQFASGGSEIFFAEFLEMNDAKLLMENLSIADEEHKILYRLLDDELPDSITDPFNVIILKADNTEITLARFRKLDDAKKFVGIKLKADVEAEVNVAYYILDGDKFLEKSDQASSAAMKNSNKSKNMIRPSPLSMRLRPRGSAHGIYNTGDDDDEDKK